MSPVQVRVLGWGIPLLGMAIGFGFAYVQFGNLMTIREEERRLVQAFEQSKSAIDQAEANRPEVQPAAMGSAMEESEFMAFLKSASDEAGVQIVRLSSSASPAAEGRTESDVLNGVVAITTSFDVEGDYLAVRAFLTRISNAPRLITIGDSSWKRTARQSTQLTVRVTRYIRSA
jgi:hypothetical protein